MKTLSAKILVLFIAVACIGCSDNEPSPSFFYGIISSSDLTVKLTACVNNGVTDVTIPSSTTISSTSYSVVAIMANTFQSCTSMVSVLVPSSVTSVSGGAFYGCTNLTAINVDASNTMYSSDNGVLFNVKKTTLIEYPEGIQGSYTLPSSVTTVGEVAFHDCAKLTGVTIPSSVTSIGSYAFYGCSGLTEIHIKASNPSAINLGSNVFYLSSTCKLYVPKGSKVLYAAADQWKDFSTIIEE